MFPSVNQVVRLVSYDERNEEKKYKAIVADITDEFIMITYPIDEQNGHTALLVDGSSLYVSYIQSDGAQYEFLTVIVRRKRENIPMLVLIKPAADTIRRIQRRDYLRVPTKLKLDFFWDTEGEPKTYAGLTVDVSGGGIKFMCSAKTPWPDGIHILACKLYVPEIGPQNIKTKQELCIPLKAKIIRRSAPDVNGLQTVALTYDEIAEVHREKIIRYCFARQLEIKNKALP
ncbi:flagellar brake protein [Aneurinibacillus sp. REN35]|uniref:flagellar brake protein n=1 Tax=Aneurinibacillus sp. REN35 TaxID=3237286 RepID=UPI00352979D1